MRVLAFLISYPPHAHVGGFDATHRYLAKLVEAGHRVDVMTSLRNQSYEIDGVRVTNIERLQSLLDKADLIVSNVGDDSRLHRVGVKENKTTIRFCHGARDDTLAKLERYGRPTLTIFNTESLRRQVAYDGPSMVCHPILAADEYVTTPGDHITLVNLLPDKGVHVFDQLARWLPERKFLAVKGGYDTGRQRVLHRPNITTIAHTGNMRDDVYARSRIVLMPSYYESWGLVGLEAFCSGIPVIAHPTPGLREALGRAGIFVDRDDLQGWIDVIESLDDRKYYKAVSTKAKARAAVVADDDGPLRFIKAVEELVG